MGKGAGLLINAKKKTNTFSKIIKIGQNTEITIETNSIDEKTNKNLNRRYIWTRRHKFWFKKKKKYQAAYTTQYIKLWLSFQSFIILVLPYDTQWVLTTKILCKIDTT